jgi:hypothetical protein
MVRKGFCPGLLAGVLTVGMLFADNGNGNGNGNGGNNADASPSGLTLNKPEVFGINLPGNGAGRAKPVSGDNGINYHGGPVMTDHINIYYIWYGDWTDKSQSILNALANGIGGSAYFNINTTYYQLAGTTPTAVPNSQGAVRLAGSASDHYSHARSLSDSDIAAVVSGAIQGTSTTGGQALGADPNGVYFVLTAADVTASSGFCRSYCGWHTYGTFTLNNTQVPIKYAFVGNPATKCPTACTNGTAAPNGDVGVDGMASVIAHELEESATDPNLNAWYDRRGEENADKCAWTFGPTITDPNTGGVYNVVLGGREFLIQRNWVNASGGSCAMSY